MRDRVAEQSLPYAPHPRHHVAHLRSMGTRIEDEDDSTSSGNLTDERWFTWPAKSAPPRRLLGARNPNSWQPSAVKVGGKGKKDPSIEKHGGCRETEKSNGRTIGRNGRIREHEALMNECDEVERHRTCTRKVSAPPSRHVVIRSPSESRPSTTLKRGTSKHKKKRIMPGRESSRHGVTRNDSRPTLSRVAADHPGKKID